MSDLVFFWNFYIYKFHLAPCGLLMWIFQENLWVSLPESPRFEEQVWDVIISSQVAAEVESGPGPGHSGE